MRSLIRTFRRTLATFGTLGTLGTLGTFGTLRTLRTFRTFRTFCTFCTFRTICAICVICGSLPSAAISGQQSAAYVYAITGARIVPVSSAAIDNATIVLRDGIIESVGAGTAAPAGAVVIQGKGL